MFPGEHKVYGGPGVPSTGEGSQVAIAETLPGASAVPAKVSGAELRLRRHADFQTVYQHARKQHAKEMSFFFSLRDNTAAAALHGPRIGLTVGKVLGKAHDRNRIKRRLRAAIRTHAGLLEGLAVDVVLHPRRSVLVLEWTRLLLEVAQTFRTIRRLLAKPVSAAVPVSFPSGHTDRRPHPSNSATHRSSNSATQPPRSKSKSGSKEKSGSGGERAPEVQ